MHTMKSLLLAVLSTHVLHATAFTVPSAFSTNRNIISNLRAEPPNENQGATNKDETPTSSEPSSNTSTTSSSQTKSSLFAEKKLYVGESFETGETLYSDLEASAELFVENEVEMKIDNGGITKKVEAETNDVAQEDMSEEENLEANEMNGTDDEEEEEGGTQMIDEISPLSEETQEVEKEEEMNIVDDTSPLSEQLEEKETVMVDEISLPFEESDDDEESSTVDEIQSESEEKKWIIVDEMQPVSEEEDEEKELSEEEATTPEEEEEEIEDKSEGKVLMAAERVEQALRLQVIAAAEEQKKFEDARAEAIRRAMALSPLAEQIQTAEKSKTKRKKDEVERAESILRGRMLLEGEIADEAAIDDSLIGSIRSFFAPKKAGVKNTKADRKKIGAAMEQEAILRTRVQASSSDTYDTIMTDSPDEPEIRLSAEEAKLAAMGAATAEQRFNKKTPEQERAVKERYGSQTSYQRAMKIMIDSGMVEGDIGDSL